MISHYEQAAARMVCRCRSPATLRKGLFGKNFHTKSYVAPDNPFSKRFPWHRRFQISSTMDR
jgi:hypothetical protein